MSDNLIKLSGFAWCKLFDAKIVDPDGWRHNDGVVLNTEITFSDFVRRFRQCTTRGVPPVLELLAKAQVPPKSPSLEEAAERAKAYMQTVCDFLDPTYDEHTVTSSLDPMEAERVFCDLREALK